MASVAGLRFGMEYVGPKTLWASARHSFVHTMVETRELIAEIGQDHVGLVLAALKELPSAKWHLDIVGGLEIEPAYAQMIKQQAQEAHRIGQGETLV